MLLPSLPLLLGTGTISVGAEMLYISGQKRHSPFQGILGNNGNSRSRAILESAFSGPKCGQTVGNCNTALDCSELSNILFL
jgi:hypothetical protein